MSEIGYVKNFIFIENRFLSHVIHPDASSVPFTLSNSIPNLPSLPVHKLNDKFDRMLDDGIRRSSFLPHKIVLRTNKNKTNYLEEKKPLHF